MLNMKKGLAIVLAAATAFTVAPVSSLGISSAVEAQAAEDNSKISVKVAVDDSKATTAKPDKSATVDATNAAKDVEVTFTGITDATEITFTDLKSLTSNDVTKDTAITIASGATSVTVKFTVPQGFVPKLYEPEYTIDMDGAGSAANPATAQKLTITNTAATYKNVQDATFAGVADTVYIRDVVDTSVELKPNYVQAHDNSSVNGSDLYYQISTTAPSSMSLSQSAYTKESELVNKDSAEILKVDASKGSIKITRENPANAFDFGNTSGAGEFYLAAYKLSTDNNGYELVGFKKITIVKYINAAYRLKLDKDSYTLSLNTIDKSGDITSNYKVSDVQGTYLTGTAVTDFAPDATAGSEGSNWTVEGANIATEKSESDYNSKAARYTQRTDIYAIYLTKERKFVANAAGKTTVTVTAANNAKDKIAQTTITLEVLGTSKYDLKATVDGSSTAGQIGDSEDNPIVLNVKTLNTYNLAQHMYKNNDSMVLSYDSSNAKNTVNETTGVVTATTAVDSFYVTVSGKINGATIAQAIVYFKVNALPFDTLQVTGEDKDEATVLSTIDYKAVKKRASGVPTEKQLAASQIKYVQIEVTGSESKQVTESLNIVSTGGAIVTASLDDQLYGNVESVTNSGVITLKKGADRGVAAIKLISAATSNNELTESYVFVVIDKKDPDTALAPAAFTIGTKTGAGWLDEDDDNFWQSNINFKKEYKADSVYWLTEDDDLLATQTLYPDAANINKNFVKSENSGNTGSPAGNVEIATAENKTMYVLLAFGTSTNGTKYEIVKITSVPGVTDKVTRIEDASNNNVIYTEDMGTVIPQVIIGGNTTLKVTLSYPIDKNKTTADISSTSLYTVKNNDPLNQNNMTATKEIVKEGDTYNTFYLYPTAQGTQVVSFNPSGNISDTNRSIITNASQKLAVTYRASAGQKPAKVTGLKVSNKKGAKVNVSWTKQSSNIRYRVYKKVGNGKWIAKNVSGNKTTLSVKKGAKVQVKVKAFVRGEDNKTIWGPKATKKTFKTDKK